MLGEPADNDEDEDAAEGLGQLDRKDLAGRGTAYLEAVIKEALYAPQPQAATQTRER